MMSDSMNEYEKLLENVVKNCTNLSILVIKTTFFNIKLINRMQENLCF